MAGPWLSLACKVSKSPCRLLPSNPTYPRLHMSRAIKEKSGNVLREPSDSASTPNQGSKELRLGTLRGLLEHLLGLLLICSFCLIDHLDACGNLLLLCFPH